MSKNSSLFSSFPSMYCIILLQASIQQRLMISSNYISPDRSNKLMPTSPQARRKQPDFPSSPQQPLLQHPLSPQHFYPQKAQGKSIDGPQQGLEGVVRQLSDRVGRLAQKLAQHEGVLIKMTENSIESNKEECKKGSKGDPRQLDGISQALTRLRREFDDYRAGNIATREIQVKNQLFSELIHKSEQRMRAELQSMLQTKGSLGGTAEQKLQQTDRLVRKLEKNVSLNTTGIFGCIQRMDTLQGNLNGHIDMVSAQFNKAYNKIVAFVNEKLSKSINETVNRLTERIQHLQGDSRVNFGEMRSSGVRSEKQASRAEYRQTLLAFSQQITMAQRTYFIDSEGYLLDEDHYYLTNRLEERIKLDEAHLQLLKQARLFPPSSSGSS